MSIKRILITGGPGTGKTAIITHLLRSGYSCFTEVARDITAHAKKQGIDQLFLDQPLHFSKLILKERIIQFTDAQHSAAPLVFFDRGIPDTVAYLNFINHNYSKTFTKACKNHVYDTVFITPPWKTIYKKDSERYESFTQLLDIHNNLVKTYESFGYKLINVPQLPVEDRCLFIINTLNTL